MSRACNPAGTGCNRVQQAWQPHAPEPFGRNRAWQVKKPCDDRFCVDPANPTTRWGDGERDADDPHASAAAGSRAARAARAARGTLGLGLLACSLLLGAAGPARAARPLHGRSCTSLACAYVRGAARAPDGTIRGGSHERGPSLQ